MDNSPEIFFDIEQLSQIMRVGAHTIRDLVKGGHYPPFCPGKFNRHFWRKSDVELLIKLIVDGTWKHDLIWKDLTTTQQDR